MVTEFELDCPICGGSLSPATVDSSSLNDRAGDERLTVARCGNCGDRYYPSETLERLH